MSKVGMLWNTRRRNLVEYNGIRVGTSEGDEYWLQNVPNKVDIKLEHDDLVPSWLRMSDEMAEDMAIQILGKIWVSPTLHIVASVDSTGTDICIQMATFDEQQAMELAEELISEHYAEVTGADMPSSWSWIEMTEAYREMLRESPTVGRIALFYQELI